MSNVVIFLFFIITWTQLVASQEINSENDNMVSNVPLDHVLKIYVYNVTNVDEFLKNESKAIVKELGPYVYTEKFENKNDSQKKVYIFNETLSSGSKDDVIVVPNVPFLTYVTLMPKGSNETNNWYRTLGEKSFVNVTVDELLFGYEDPLMTFAKNFANRPGQPLIRDKSFEGVIKLLDPESTGLIKYGLVWANEVGTAVSKKDIPLDGCPIETSLGKINRNSFIHAYHENFCRLIPLRYKKTISENENLTVYRFTCNIDLIVYVKKLFKNRCFCPGQTQNRPCPALDTNSCPYVGQYPLSFPHFYKSDDDSFRTAVEGISPPDPEKHTFYIDVEPTTGKVINSKARLQFNFAVPRTEGIDLMEGFPEMIFPIFWFEEGSQ